jgi:hypothetical protein
MSRSNTSLRSPWAPCFVWLLLLSIGCQPGAGTRPEAEPAAATRPAPQPYVETVPGSTMTFTMKPVTIRDDSGGPSRVLWFAETETTWDAYDVFSLRLDENPGNVAAAGGAPDAITRPTQPYAPADRGWGHGGFPVISVTHNAATRYCEWLTQKTRRRYRLPTPAEWRAGAAADDDATTQPASVEESAWLSENSRETTQPVARKRPNANGLYDTVGNVAEWCAAEPGAKPVVLGGSFMTAAADLGPAIADGERQTAAWTIGDPSLPPSKWWLRDAPFVGFRVVCEEPPK